jgi:hypothetical protein
MRGMSLVLISTLAVAFSMGPIWAQDAGGISQCLAGCAKSDKPCQDHCVPASAMNVPARACVETCRFTAAEPDLLVRLKACIGTCLDQNAVSQ